MSNLYGSQLDTASNAHEIHATKAKKLKAAPGHTTLVTDESIKAMRALFDYRGWSKKELSEYFKINYSSVARAIDGLTRAKLSHSEADVPSGL